MIQSSAPLIRVCIKLERGDFKAQGLLSCNFLLRSLLVCLEHKLILAALIDSEQIGQRLTRTLCIATDEVLHGRTALHSLRVHSCAAMHNNICYESMTAARMSLCSKQTRSDLSRKLQLRRPCAAMHNNICLFAFEFDYIPYFAC